MTYGEKISDLRKKRGMTQDDLGKAMNVSYQAVSKWERGESQPDFETMSKIAKLFGVPIGYFEEDSTPDQNEEKPDGAEQTPAESEEKEEKDDLPPQPIGVCTVCGKMLHEGEEATTTPKLVCKPCDARLKQQAKQAAEQKQQAAKQAREQAAREVIGHGFDATLIISIVLTLACYILFTVLTFKNLDSDDLLLYGVLLFVLPLCIFGLTHSISGGIKELRDVDDESGYSLVLSLIMGAVFAVVHIALFLAIYLSVGEGENLYFLGLLIIGAILTFTFVSQYLWGSAIQEVFTAGGFTFKLPGFIITLSIDSILWMIVTKFLLGILAVIVFVVTTVIVALVAIFGSVFFFIPCLLLKLGRDRKAKKSVNA